MTISSSPHRIDTTQSCPTATKAFEVSRSSLLRLAQAIGATLMMQDLIAVYRYLVNFVHGECLIQRKPWNRQIEFLRNVLPRSNLAALIATHVNQSRDDSSVQSSCQFAITLYLYKGIFSSNVTLLTNKYFSMSKGA